MAKVLWDEYEQAVLLKALIDILDGKRKRTEIIPETSDRLRKLAISRGYDVDEKFRNVNGIALQLSKLEYAYTNTKSGLRTETGWYFSIVELYRNDPECFSYILKEEIKMESKDMDKLNAWLLNNTDISPASFHRYLNSLYILMLKNKIEAKNALTIENINDIRNIIDELLNNKSLVQSRELRTTYIKCLETYINYLSSTENFSREISDEIDMDISQDIMEAENKESTIANFKLWMKLNGMAPSSIRGYSSAMIQCKEIARDQGIDDDLIAIIDVEKAVQIRNRLLSNEVFQRLNAKNHNRYTVAINKFIDYLIEPRANEITQLKKISDNKKIQDNYQLKDDIKLNLETILKENFSNGLVPNSMRLDKFRMLYSEKYGLNLTDDNDLLKQQIQQIGVWIDGRIYPKQNSEQDLLLDEIIDTLRSTLASGANCVYLICVLERWREKLNSTLNIYSVEMLRDSLKNKNTELIITDSIIKKTNSNGGPEDNVLDLMKNSHFSLNYTQIKEKLWFIPLNVIKRCLVDIPSIVNVDSETYFYAPNFPASNSDLIHLKNLMQNEIDVRDFITGKDIFTIIHAHCPEIAVNTQNYKYWAYRNILGYLFKNDFEFQSSIVCNKGVMIELHDVYRDYCNHHDMLDIDDLKSLSESLGVPIYWDDVIDVMIRVNEKTLVKRENIIFDIDKIDAVLDKLCPKAYISIQDINVFLHFPSIRYPWNEFVLESYLLQSRKFILLHSTYSQDRVCGVIVRKKSNYKSYADVVVDALAQDREWKTANDALDYIVRIGFQARRRWTNFEAVYQKARILREKYQSERI